jgi:hypothetical protein
MKILYCGGCNPHIEREALAAELEADERLRDSDVAVYISGCRRSCRTGHRLVLDTPGTLVVAGEHLDGTPVPATELAERIRRRLALKEGVR